MKRAVLVLAFAMAPSLFAQGKTPVISDADKANLAVEERDLAQLQAQIQSLQAQYQSLVVQATNLINSVNSKAGVGWNVNPQNFTFTYTKPVPKKK